MYTYCALCKQDPGRLVYEYIYTIDLYFTYFITHNFTFLNANCNIDCDM